MCLCNFDARSVCIPCMCDCRCAQAMMYKLFFYMSVFAEGGVAQHWPPSSLFLQSVLLDPWTAAALWGQQTHPHPGQRLSFGPWSKLVALTGGQQMKRKSHFACLTKVSPCTFKMASVLHGRNSPSLWNCPGTHLLNWTYLLWQMTFGPLTHEDSLWECGNYSVSKSETNCGTNHFCGTLM